MTNDPAATLVPTLVADNVVIGEDAVRILDRRRFPFEREWVTCRSYEDVAKAIEDMVTQSSGPFFAAGAGMALAGREADRLPAADRLPLMREAGARLVRTRPTNNHIAVTVRRLLAIAEQRAGTDASLGETMETAARAEADYYLARSKDLGRHAAELLEDGDTVLNHCWAESYVTETFAAALRQGKTLKAVCTETRPYLQGARLTAESLAEIGVETTVITDNMGAWAMATGKVTKLLTAADRVTMDGHVINKVGTLQLALAAREYAIPYIALVHEPDTGAPTAADVPMEERDPEETLHCLGMRTASYKAHGWYPAFDATPPKLVSAIVTDRGRFSPYDLQSHFAGEAAEEQAEAR